MTQLEPEPERAKQFFQGHQRQIGRLKIQSSVGRIHRPPPAWNRAGFRLRLDVDPVRCDSVDLARAALYPEHETWRVMIEDWYAPGESLGAYLERGSNSVARVLNLAVGLAFLPLLAVVLYAGVGALIGFGYFGESLVRRLPMGRGFLDTTDHALGERLAFRPGGLPGVLSQPRAAACVAHTGTVGFPGHAVGVWPYACGGRFGFTCFSPTVE